MNYEHRIDMKSKRKSHYWKIDFRIYRQIPKNIY